MSGMNVLPMAGLKLAGWEDLLVGFLSSMLNVLESISIRTPIILSAKDAIRDGD